MLLLSRNNDQEIILHDKAHKYFVTIRVCKSRNGQVQLGIEAPPSVIVDRKEVYEAKVKNNTESKRILL